ncbi:13987_t:CDS:2, partial [Funneliformis mosseae]
HVSESFYDERKVLKPHKRGRHASSYVVWHELTSKILDLTITTLTISPFELRRQKDIITRYHFLKREKFLSQPAYIRTAFFILSHISHIYTQSLKDSMHAVEIPPNSNRPILKADDLRNQLNNNIWHEWVDIQSRSKKLKNTKLLNGG